MKICWDNLKGVRLNSNGNFNKGSATYIYADNCSICGETYLMDKYAPTSKCSLSCSRKGSGNSMYGKSFPGKNNPNYKGGVKKKGLPLFSTYADKIDIVESVRRSISNTILLEVKCTYCGRWFIPSINSVQKRIQFIDGRGSGEGRLYCSSSCKNSCPIYRRVKFPADFKKATSREVQSELRQMVLERDNWTCQICNKIIEEVELHCHHISGVEHNPIESADIDNCITLCKNCHKAVHKLPGCKYHELKKCMED